MQKAMPHINNQAPRDISHHVLTWYSQVLERTTNCATFHNWTHVASMPHTLTDPFPLLVTSNGKRICTAGTIETPGVSIAYSFVPSRGTARLLRPGGPPAWRTDIDTHKTTKGGLPRRDSWYPQKCPPHKMGLLACTVCARYLGLRAPLSARVWVDCSAPPMRSAPVGHGHLSPGPCAPSRSGHGLRLGVARAGAGPGRCPVGHPAVARRACLGVLAYA